MLTVWTRTYPDSGSAQLDTYGVRRATASELVRARCWPARFEGRTPPGATTLAEAEGVVFGATAVRPGDRLTDDVGVEWEVVEALYVRGFGLAHWSVKLTRSQGTA